MHVDRPKLSPYVPDKHAVHVVVLDPNVLLYVPSEHGTGRLIPTVGHVLPTVHGIH